MKVTDSLNPVIDEVVESSTTAEELSDIDSSQSESGEGIEAEDTETVVASEEVDEESTEEEESDSDVSDNDKPSVERRIGKLVADKKNAEKALAERTSQLHSLLGDAHSIPSRPNREDYSSEDSYEGALMNYKMKLANAEDAQKRAVSFVRESLDSALSGLVQRDIEAIQNLKGMPSAFIELLSISRNPEEIVIAMKDRQTRDRMKNLPPHLIGAEFAKLDNSFSSTKAKSSQKQAAASKKGYTPVNDSASSSNNRSNAVPTMEQTLALMRAGKI